MRITGVVLVLLMCLVGCGGEGSSQEPAAKESSSTPPTASSTTDEPVPTFVESERCRRDAGEVVDILELSLRDKDIRDFAGRLDTVDGLLPEAVSQCSSKVSRTINEAQDALGASFDAAMAGDTDGPNPMVRGAKKVAAARSLLDAES